MEDNAPEDSKPEDTTSETPEPLEKKRKTTEFLKAAKDFLTPASFIRAAEKAHPAFRYALAAAGILAIIVSFSKFGVSYATLALGAIAFIGLMVLFFVFAQATNLAKTRLARPAEVLIWSFLGLGLVIALGLVSSVFFNWPLPFRDSIAEKLSGKIATSPPGATVVPKDSLSTEKAIIAAEVKDGYVASGQMLRSFDEWGKPEYRPTLHLGQDQLMVTINGANISMSIDPKQLPVMQYTSEVSKLGGEEASTVVQFFSAYNTFKAALTSLNANPDTLSSEFIDVTETARDATTKGRAALCAMGAKPPWIQGLPNSAYRQPMPTNCSMGPAEP